MGAGPKDLLHVEVTAHWWLTRYSRGVHCGLPPCVSCPSSASKAPYNHLAALGILHTVVFPSPWPDWCLLPPQVSWT